MNLSINIHCFRLKTDKLHCFRLKTDKLHYFHKYLKKIFLIKIYNSVFINSQTRIIF